MSHICHLSSSVHSWARLLVVAAAIGASASGRGENASSLKITTMTQAVQQAMSPRDALELLRAGNERFCKGKMLARNLHEQVEATAHGQYPFASILSCIDSRTSSELIFDLGIGDVFNVRIAGNIINDDILGSLEYAHKVAGAKLLVVIGHSHCGAVKGAADDVILGNITTLVSHIRPAVAATSSEGPDRTSTNHAFIDKAARMNVLMTVRAIRERSPILREMQDKGLIDIVGGFYDVETGKVEFYRPFVDASGDAPRVEHTSEDAGNKTKGSPAPAQGEPKGHAHSH